MRPMVVVVPAPPRRNQGVAACGSCPVRGASRHLGHYVSVFSVPNHLGLDREEVTYPLPGRTTLVYSTRRDTGAKAMFLFAAPPLAYDRRDTGRQKQLLADAFAGAGWEVPALLRAVRDAASGQGTGLALVGAYVLAGELAAAGGDHGGAFRRYEQRVRGFVDANQGLTETVQGR